MRLLLTLSLIVSASASAGPEQRNSVGDGGLGDLVSLIDAEQPAQSVCGKSGLSDALSAEQRALADAGSLGCKAVAGHIDSLAALAQQASTCHDTALQQQAQSLSSRFRQIDGSRCQASQLDTAGQITALTELGLNQVQQRENAKQARREQERLARLRQEEQARAEAAARSEALARQARTTAGAVTTTSSLPPQVVTDNAPAGSQGLPPPAGPAPGYSNSGGSQGNRRSGFIYDDTNHSQCLSLRTTGQNRGSRMAYGHYELVNRCNYALTAQICTVSDNADGSPSDSWNKFQEGAPCPGGWGGAAFKAGEVQKGRTWFEFRNIRAVFYACKEGWSIVNPQDKSIYLIGEKHRCRLYH